MKNILVADDSLTARMVVIRCLQIAGVKDATFIEASDGSAALEWAQNLKPDLILADLNMPFVDGATLLRNLKSDPELEHIPVVIVSSSINQARGEELKSLGAMAVVPKPVSPKALHAALASLMDAGKGRP